MTTVVSVPKLIAHLRETVPVKQSYITISLLKQGYTGSSRTKEPACGFPVLIRRPNTIVELSLVAAKLFRSHWNYGEDTIDKIYFDFFGNGLVAIGEDNWEAVEHGGCVYIGFSGY